MSNRGINKVILVGNLGDDPETKFTQGGMAITKGRIATTSQRKDRDGNKVEETQWHRVTFMGKLGEIAGEYLKKGSQVYVEGSIRYGKYTGQDGIERYSTDIIADAMQMLGGTKRDGDGRNSSASRSTKEAQPQRQAPPAKSSDFADDFHDDDIPF